ncbi:MAG: PQQ-binding-like beta-propeller repeat protein [Bdellovibrionales bacterium]|nr:PQQ-binding-like beta-propeller repeat protein [Bdellovibrionales bacterium]
MAGSGVWAWAISAEGDIKWRFQLASGSRGIMTPAIDQGLVYLATSTGEVLALNKTSGAAVADQSRR